MTREELLCLAAGEGFTAAAVVNTEDIRFDPAFRAYCEENLCGNYGANYSCPPHCGSPEEMRRRITARPLALVLQSVWPVSDYSDEAAIRRAKREHNAASRRLVEKLKENGHSGTMLGAGSCDLCDPCEAAEGRPCSFPGQRYSCMSAYCIHVRKLTELTGMDYDCGEGRLSLFGMYVFDR